MITCQCAEAMPTYAPQSSYLTPIPSANIERGVAPLDSLPADWWNWLWNNITLNEGRIVQFINSVFSEINSVLSAAGVTPSTASTTDLKTAIQKLATTVATTAVPGSVLSSTLSGKLRVIADGTASINGLGTPDQLETTSKEVVSAINEVLALAQGKAPTSHASSDTTYGVGTTQQYGHVKVTEGCGLAISCGTISLNAPGYNCTGTVTAVCFNGTKYTPSGGVVSFNASGANCTGTVTAVCYNGTKYTPSGGVVNLGNAPTGFPGYGTAICSLNGNTCCASSAGTSNLVARADHVHAMPSRLCYDCSFMCLLNIAATLGSAYTCIALQGGCDSSSNIFLYMRGRCIAEGRVSSYLGIRTDSYGERITVTAQNGRGCCTSQAYLPRAPLYKWSQVQSLLGIGTCCPFSGGYVTNCILLGGYFDSNGCVHYRTLNPVSGCICSSSADGSSLSFIQGVITWVQ